jgi:membrane-bound lytic murein transglycosylase D
MMYIRIILTLALIGLYGCTTSSKLTEQAEHPISKPEVPLADTSVEIPKLTVSDLRTEHQQHVLLSSLSYPDVIFDTILPPSNNTNEDEQLEDEQPEETNLKTSDDISQDEDTAEEIQDAIEEAQGVHDFPVVTNIGPRWDVWQRIRTGYRLQDHYHPGVKGDLNWFAKNPGYLLRTSERAVPYMYYIMEELKARDMPTEIALLPIVESAFQPFAYSHGRAAGIWQFIPGTGRLYGLKQNWWYDGRRDVYAATKAALNYLEYLHKYFDGDWLLALAAYNSGEGTVRKAVKRNRKRGKATDFWSLKLPRETRGYVPKLLALARIVGDPEQYNVTLTDIPDTPYFEKVDIGSQIDLALAAELTEISTEEIYQLNPGFNRWATDPDGPHYLLIPQEKAESFKIELAKIPVKDRIRWARHKIRSGETLSHIAKRYHTSVAQIRKVNNLRGHNITAGKYLLIPSATREISSYTMTADKRKSQIQNRSRDGEKTSYRVRSGDTLWDISKLYNVSVRKLASWNAMAPRDVLKPGQKLVIWSKEAPSLASPPSAVTQKIRYTVRRGDSLSRIAQKFRVSINDLVRWNKLNKKKYLRPGQRLTLYIDITRQSGS